MKKIKLNLKEKENTILSGFATNHGTSVDAVPLVYTNLVPVKVDYDALLATFNTRLADEITKRTALDEAVILTEQARVDLENALRSRAARVVIIADDDEAVIVAAGFEVANTNPGPIGELPAPQNLKALVTDVNGRLDVKWKGVNGAKSYVVECRTHGATPGAWQLAKIITAAKCSVTGLTPGQEYAFRVRAVGAAGEGPWSDETVKMAI